MPVHKGQTAACLVLCTFLCPCPIIVLSMRDERLHGQGLCKCGTLKAHWVNTGTCTHMSHWHTAKHGAIGHTANSPCEQGLKGKNNQAANRQESMEREGGVHIGGYLGCQASPLKPSGNVVSTSMSSQKRRMPT